MNSPCSAGLLLRLLGLGGGMGGCLACGGMGGGESGVAGTKREGSSLMRDTVLGGLATATATAEDDEEEEEEEEEDEDEKEAGGAAVRLEGSEGRGGLCFLGGSRACLPGGGSLRESRVASRSLAGLEAGMGAKRTPADSEARTHTHTHTHKHT